MPLFDDTMDEKTIPGSSGFQYSGTRPENLGEDNYSLVTVATDFSYSTYEFARYLRAMLIACVEACQKNPRNRNIMLRALGFNDNVLEIHGFKPLNLIATDDYEEFNPDGCTALYDAVFSSVGATLDYAKTLYDNEVDSVNGICFIITDGLNNRGTTTPKMIKDKIQKALKSEELSSLTTVLIQLKDPSNTDPGVEDMLRKFREEADISAFIDVNDVTPEVLAKLGRIISKSISTVSNSLQTGATVSQQSLSI